MTIEEDPPSGVPDWVITYGDMMSLLLTFFILLASMSEIRENDKYQGVADSMHEHFGIDRTVDSYIPGESRPRNSALAALALTGRSKRKSVLEGGQKTKSSKGDKERVRIIRPGSRTAIGTVIYFNEEAAALDEEARNDLLAIGDLLRGKPQKIEVRGHTSQRPLSAGALYADHLNLAFRRAESTMQFLVESLGVDPQRIRLSVAGPHEPVQHGLGPEEQKENPRVEVFLLEEIVNEPKLPSMSSS